MDQNIKKELDNLKTAIASADAKYKEIVANPKKNEMTMEDCMAAMSYLHERVGHVYSYASRVEDSLHEFARDHSGPGHLPKIVGADKMNKALKALGMDGDYQVEKKMIRASKDQVIVNYTTPFNK